MDDRLPLPTLLSQALVAFTIEFDNEFEHQAPHQTTGFASTRGAPWLVSMVMWSRFLRYVPDEGISVRDLQLQSRRSRKDLQQWLPRLSRWWGYLVVEAKAGVTSKRIQPDAMVRPTAGGRKALSAWRPLTGLIETRWHERFGHETIEELRELLFAISSQLDPNLPDSLPILGYGLVSTGPEPVKGEAVQAGTAVRSLPGLLSRVLLAFAIEFERESEVSLAIAANVLRLAGGTGVRIRDLPRLSGVSKEAIAMAVSFLGAKGYASVKAESPASRVKLLVLTEKGSRAQKIYMELLGNLEASWLARFGSENIWRVRAVLERLIGEPNAQSTFMSGLLPYPDCWRSSVRAPETLPHFPMMLHRGGFPDGS